MKKTAFITALALLAAVSAGWAHDKQLGGNEDLYQSPLLDHDKGSRNVEAQQGEGDLYGSHIADPQEVVADPRARVEPIGPREALHEQDPEGYGFN